MNPIRRYTLRFSITSLGLGISLYIASRISRILNVQILSFVGLILLYLITTYAVFPFLVRLYTRHSKHIKQIQRYTRSADGMPTDPINVLLVGTQEQIEGVFRKIGWHVADDLNFKTSLKMTKSFVFRKDYPTAPFSWLYFDGRKQDIGFQKAIGGDPRKRHHVRYWRFPVDATYKYPELTQWLEQNTIPDDAEVWVGAGTKDTGFGITKFTWQISHAVDKDANQERDHIVAELQKTGQLSAVKKLAPPKGHVFTRSFTTDGVVSAALLK